jgi:hypothetical protein
MARKAAARPRTRSAPVPVTAAPSTVTIANMIPRSLSRETNQDSEPTITVNPANPLEIVGTAFTPDPLGGGFAPIFFSTDGGDTWQLNSIVPSAIGNGSTADISLAFASSGGGLYGGILRQSSTNFETLRTTTFSAPTPMSILGSRPENDQPFTHAITNAGHDRVYIGNNDFQASPQTATIDVSMDANVNNPVSKEFA